MHSLWFLKQQNYSLNWSWIECVHNTYRATSSGSRIWGNRPSTMIKLWPPFVEFWNDAIAPDNDCDRNVSISNRLHASCRISQTLSVFGNTNSTCLVYSAECQFTSIRMRLWLLLLLYSITICAIRNRAPVIGFAWEWTRTGTRIWSCVCGWQFYRFTMDDYHQFAVWIMYGMQMHGNTITEKINMDWQTNKQYKW